MWHNAMASNKSFIKFRQAAACSVRGSPSSSRQARTPTCRSRAVRRFSLRFGHDRRWYLHAAPSSTKGILGRTGNWADKAPVSLQPTGPASLSQPPHWYSALCSPKVVMPQCRQLPRLGLAGFSDVHCISPLPPPLLPQPAWGPDLRLPLLFLAGRKLLLLTFFFLSSPLPYPSTPSRIGFPARPKPPSPALRVRTYQPCVHLVPLQTTFM